MEKNLERESFVFHHDWYTAIEKLDDKIQLEVYKAITQKAFNNKDALLSPMAELAMTFINPQMQRDYDKWLEIKKKRKESGMLGGRPSKANKTKQKQKNQTVSEKPNGLQENQIKPNETNSVSVCVSDNDLFKESSSIELPKKNPTWVDDYEAYTKLIDDALGKLFVDDTYRKQVEELYPNIDYKRTLIACSMYWKQEEQWKSYKRKKVKKPNFVSAIKNGFHINKIYKQKGATSEYGYPQSVDDVKADDVQPTLTYFFPWMNKVAPKVCDGLVGGYPENEEQYQHLINHTIGGARALCYVVLVFQRDGWSEYYDERGFMWTYYNYIKENGLFKE